MAPAGQEAGDSGTIGTGAFNPERANLSQAPGPPFELTVPEHGHRHMVVLVSVDSDDSLDSTTTFTFTTHNSCHSYLPEDGAPTR